MVFLEVKLEMKWSWYNNYYQKSEIERFLAEKSRALKVKL